MKQNLSDLKLRERLLLSRRVEGDTLVLPDEVLAASIAGTRTLTEAERALLAGSPLTLRRFRQLSIDARARCTAANDAQWRGSEGLLRAAASTDELARLSTDDGYWTLHFAQQGGRRQAILQVAADAPFAARLLASRAPVRVLDGNGTLVLEGILDADGECEAPWPFADAPAAHFQDAGARFSVSPAG
ncbi:hypothetical protein [Pseudoduganella sp. GCM10020061]|uniref:hypothetical protein n=1 Tax=Pseudoduganella sp. GCM10020061 TaxID=3317345 RepID=UPI003641540B